MNTNKAYIDRRTKEIRAGVDKAYASLEAGRISHERFDEIMSKAEAEQEQLNIARRTRAKALSFAHCADSDEHVAQHGFGFGVESQQSATIASKKWSPPSPYDLNTSQLETLFYAAKNRMPSFSQHISDEQAASGGAVRTKNMTIASGVHNKDWSTPAAIAEGTPGSMLAPEMLPSAFPLRYEPTRLFEFFVGKTAGSQSVQWLQHSGNDNPAAAVAELAQKPDIGPQITPHTVAFTTIAAMATISRFLLEDFADGAFMSFLPRELYAAVVDAENDEILNGDGSDPHMRGLLHTSGTLTRSAVLSSSPSITEIDVLMSAANDLRVGSAFAVADLIILNPTDWDYIRKLKNTLGSYILQSVEPNLIGGIDNIFGIRVATTTKMAQGTGIVMDSKIATLAWTRMGMEILSSQFGDWAFQHNAWMFRAEERVAIGVQYPKAISVVTGLNPQVGS